MCICKLFKSKRIKSKEPSIVDYTQPKAFVRTWSIVDFAKKHGKLQIGKFPVNNNRESYWKAQFVKSPNETIPVIISSRMQGITSKEISQNKDRIKIGELPNGKHVMFDFRWKDWEDVDLGLQRMKTLREWALYYNSKSIAVWPSNQSALSINFDDWRRQSKMAVNEIDWEDSKFLRGIAGKMGLTVLEMKFVDKEEDYIFKVVSRVLYLLGLCNYPWVIYEGKRVWFLFECGNPDNIDIERFGPISILHKGIYDLPWVNHTSRSGARYYFRGTPESKIIQVSSNILRKTITKIVDEFGLFFDKEIEE